MRRNLPGLALVAVAVLVVGGASAWGTDAEMYFSSDKAGENRVSQIQEGAEVFIVVFDPDENIDCDVRDKVWTDVKLFDPKTGATIVWKSYLDAAGDANDTRYHEPGYVPYQGHWPGNTAGWLGADYLEETGADTGVFVSKRPFRIGTRESYGSGTPELHTHVIDVAIAGDLPGVGATTFTDEFQWGHYLYADGNADLHADNRGYFGGSIAFTFHQGMEMSWLYPARMPSEIPSFAGDDILVGRFENMDTLVGMVQDPNDPTDVAVAMMKIIDVEASIAWDRQIYPDPNEAATITVIDPDENLDSSRVEAVPVFVLVNPGSWNPVDANPAIGDGGRSPTNFCMLRSTGGVDEGGNVLDWPIRWYSIYDQAWNTDHRHRIQYPTALDDPDNVTVFDTIAPDGVTPVLFYAWETGVATGVFQLNLNSILDDLGFNSLRVRDVLVAYYLDPNDFDDFKLATATIEERQHSLISFTDADRNDQAVYWLGRDSVYIRVIDSNANVDPCCPEQVVVHLCDPHGEDDSEWLILDEASSNSPVFFTLAGLELDPVWNALGIGIPEAMGGFELQLDNWKLEAFNEDDVYVRYNDVTYGAPPIEPTGRNNDIRLGIFGLGDKNIFTSWPPLIWQLGYSFHDSGPGGVDTRGIAPKIVPGVRVANDVSFDTMSIADTQVFDGEATRMWFLDRQGNRVTGYVNSDCVFVEVLDPDQDEDQLRRERIDGYWDGAQNVPFGPMALNEFDCDWTRDQTHFVNALLGDTNIFNDTPAGAPNTVFFYQPKLYVLNPRSGRWAAIDLLETGPATGDFVSVICIDLNDPYSCVPTLDVIPGDTILAFYQDPSNHSDSAMISIKVGVGGEALHRRSRRFISLMPSETRYRPTQPGMRSTCELRIHPMQGTNALKVP